MGAPHGTGRGRARTKQEAVLGYAPVAMQFLALRRWADLDEAERARLLARSTAAIFDPALMTSIEAIFADVRERGDAAVIDATERFDGVRLTADRLAVTDRKSVV